MASHRHRFVPLSQMRNATVAHSPREGNSGMPWVHDESEHEVAPYGSQWYWQDGRKIEVVPPPSPDMQHAADKVWMQYDGASSPFGWLPAEEWARYVQTDRLRPVIESTLPWSEDEQQYYRTASIRPADPNELVTDSTGEQMSAGFYPGTSLVSEDENGRPHGWLLHRTLPDNTLWVDSIYGTHPNAAMELLGHIRDTYPGQRVEGYFANKRLGQLVDRYNMMNGHEPWPAQQRREICLQRLCEDFGVSMQEAEQVLAYMEGQHTAANIPGPWYRSHPDRWWWRKPEELNDDAYRLAQPILQQADLHMMEHAHEYPREEPYGSYVPQPNFWSAYREHVQQPVLEAWKNLQPNIRPMHPTMRPWEDLPEHKRRLYQHSQTPEEARANYEAQRAETYDANDFYRDMGPGDETERTDMFYPWISYWRDKMGKPHVSRIDTRYAMPYHVSPQVNRRSIEQNGLEGEGGDTYYWDTPEQAQAYWKWLMDTGGGNGPAADIWHFELTPEEDAAKQNDQYLHRDMQRTWDLTQRDVKPWEDVNPELPSMFYNDKGEFGAWSIPTGDWAHTPDGSVVPWDGMADDLREYRITPDRLRRITHYASRRNVAPRNPFGFFKFAADIEALAQKAYQNLEKREDIARILEKDRGHTREEAEVYSFMRAVTHSDPGNDAYEQIVPPETYKMWEWFVGQLKRGNVSWITNGAHALDILVQATKWMQWSKEYNQPTPDWKRFDFSQMQQWVYDMNGKDLTSDSQWTNEHKIYQFPDGWYMAEVSADDCKLEGELMGHCVGGYGHQIANGSSYIVSLRDPKGDPHVTLEMIGQKPEGEQGLQDGPHDRYRYYSPQHYTWYVQQIQGKQDREPIDEYKAYIKQWFQSLKDEGLSIAWSDDSVQHDPDLDYDEPEWDDSNTKHLDVKHLNHILDAHDLINQEGLRAFQEGEYGDARLVEDGWDDKYDIDGRKRYVQVYYPEHTIALNGSMGYNDQGGQDDYSHLFTLWQQFIQNILAGKISDPETIKDYVEGFYFVPQTHAENGNFADPTRITQGWNGNGSPWSWTQLAQRTVQAWKPQIKTPEGQGALFDQAQYPDRPDSRRIDLVNFAVKYMQALYSKPGSGYDRTFEPLALKRNREIAAGRPYQGYDPNGVNGETYMRNALEGLPQWQGQPGMHLPGTFSKVHSQEVFAATANRGLTPNGGKTASDPGVMAYATAQAARFMRALLSGGDDPETAHTKALTYVWSNQPGWTQEQAENVVQQAWQTLGIGREPSADDMQPEWSDVHDWHNPETPLDNALRDLAMRKDRERSINVDSPNFVRQWPGGGPLNFPNQPYLSGMSNISNRDGEHLAMGARGGLPTGLQISVHAPTEAELDTLPADDYTNPAKVAVVCEAYLPGEVGGTKIGYLYLYRDGEIADVDVLPEYRRMGVASAMLDYLRSNGYDVHHSEAITDDGQAWADHVGAYLPDTLRRDSSYFTFDAPDGHGDNVYPEHGEMPQRFYHVAPRSVREKIMREGLTGEHTWNTGGDWDPETEMVNHGDDMHEWRPSGVYMFNNYHDARNYAGLGGPGYMERGIPNDIWEVTPTSEIIRDPSQAPNWGYDQDWSNAYVTPHVPPHALRLVHPDEHLARTIESMAERSGDPQLDALIEEYHQRFPADATRDPDACGGSANAFVNYLRLKGVKAYHVTWDLEAGDQAGDYSDRPSKGNGWHEVVQVVMPSGTYMIDWTASQYGYTEFPMVQKLQDGQWSRDWGLQGPESGAQGVTGASVKRSDYNGWTNWDTWHTALMMDNERESYDAVREGVERGWTVEQFAHWVLQHVVGPYNAQTLKDTQEWNDLSLEERQEEYPDAPDHEDDDQPQLMDEHAINWQEIYDHLVDEIESNKRYEQEQAAERERNPPPPFVPPTPKYQVGQQVMIVHPAGAQTDIRPGTPATITQLPPPVEHAQYTLQTEDGRQTKQWEGSLAPMGQPNETGYYVGAHLMHNGQPVRIIDGPWPNDNESYHGPGQLWRIAPHPPGQGDWYAKNTSESQLTRPGQIDPAQDQTPGEWTLNDFGIPPEAEQYYRNARLNPPEGWG